MSATTRPPWDPDGHPASQSGFADTALDPTGANLYAASLAIASRNYTRVAGTRPCGRPTGDEWLG